MRGERSPVLLTTSFSVANWTLTLLTPSTALTAFSMVRAQVGQSIPSTFQLNCWSCGSAAEICPLASLSPSAEPLPSSVDVGECSLGCDAQLSDAQQDDAATGA